MAAVSLPVTAQTTGSPYEPELQQIVLEGKLDPANLLPPDKDLAAVVADGSLELRFRIDNWGFRNRIYRMSVFVVTAGSPLPTPANQLPDPTSQLMVVQGNIRAETIFHSKSGNGPVMGFAGRVVLNLGGIGRLSPGDVWMIGFTYPAEAFNQGGAPQATFQRISVLVTGDTVGFIDTAKGAIVVAPPSN